MTAPRHIPLAKPWLEDDEAEAAADVVRSGWLFMGPRVKEFEQEFAASIGVRHAVALNSGSSALLACLLAFGIEAGDEILTPDITFVSTASSALFVGARPRFVDIEQQTYGMSPEDLERRITPRTKLIVPVHYAGHTAEMTAILDIAERHGIPVLEDAAEAQTSQYKGRYAGTLGHAGIFSFTPSKPMTVGEGGMAVTDDPEFADKLRLIRNFGDAGKFDWQVLGFNLRMMDIQAAIGLRQMRKLDEFIRLRHRIADRYNHGLRGIPGIITPFVRSRSQTNFMLYTIRVDAQLAGITRDDLMQCLADAGVASRVYFPPLHRARVFAHLVPGTDEDFPNASAFADTALSLPIYAGMTEEDICYVIDVIRTSIESRWRLGA